MDDEGAKGQIPAAAFELLSQMPFQKMSLGMVAKRAGVSKALILYHFGSKKELTRQALKAGFLEARGDPHPHEKAMLLALAMIGMVSHVEEREPDMARYEAAVIDIIGLEARA